MACERIGIAAVAVIMVVLMSFADGCSVTFVTPPAGNTTTDGSGNGGDGSSTTGNDPTTTPNESNPNSPCADQTDIQVTYVNESTAVVTFVEAFVDNDGQFVSKNLIQLKAAGNASATYETCITCPARAGIRTIALNEGGQYSSATPPPDLSRGSFKCGDHITFTVAADKIVHTTVETP
jgi:hypothetical protein